MRRSLVLLACAISGILTGMTLSAANAEVPLIQVGKAEAPAIDGQLTDACWQTCAQAFPFLVVDGTRPAGVQTKALLCYDAERLFIAFECEEPKMDKLVAEYNVRDGSLWQDDCVELLLRRPGQSDFAHIIVNTLGATYEAKGEESSWNPAVAVAVAKGENRWSVELGLPWADLGGTPATDETWTGNLCRERHVESELSSWSRALHRFTTPATFGQIVFAETPVRVEAFTLPPPLPGTNVAKLTLAMPGATEAQVRVNGADTARWTPDMAQPVELFYPCGLTDEALTFEARLGERVAWRGAFPVSIEPRPALAGLLAAIEASRAVADGLPADNAYAQSLKKALDSAQQAADALKNAFDASSAEKRPLEETEYKRLNAAAATEILRLERIRWPLWTKSNWANVERNESPASTEEVNTLSFTSLVNEYESGNFIVTNFGKEPLRLRVTASDWTWQPETKVEGDTLVSNGNFELDANNDGIPDQWGQFTGDKRLCRLDSDPERGKVLLVDCDGTDAGVTVRQNIELEAGKSYTVEYWVRAENATPDVTVAVINNGWTRAHYGNAIGGTVGWRREVFSFTAPESPGHQLLVWAKGLGNGKTWLDDIRLVEGGTSAVTFEGSAPRLSMADWQELRGGSIVADPLIPLNPAGRIDVPPGENRQVWLTLPACNLPPGCYSGVINVEPLATVQRQGASPSKSISLQLNVLPARISTHPDFAVYNWDYALSDADAREEAYARDLMDHKVTFFLVATHIPLPTFDAQGNAQGEMDFTKLDRNLRTKLRYARETGGQVMFSYGIIRDFHADVKAKYDWDFVSPPWVAAFRHAYTKWLEHLKALGFGYEDFCVQIWDEATGTGDVGRTVEGGKLLRELDPKVRLVMDGAQTVEEITQMEPYVDVWVPILGRLEDKTKGPALLAKYRELQAQGKPVYTYTCSTFMKAQSPYTYHRLKPWSAANLGLDGVFYWAYNSWRGDPWNDFDSEIADCGVIYPGEGGPITSRRWEASREGIEDWQIMRLLTRVSPSGEGATLVAEALNAVLSSKDNVALADEWRLKLVKKTAEIAASEPLTLSGVGETQEGETLTVRFTANRAVSGIVWYRLAGDVVWQEQPFTSATEQSMAITLPPFAKADWIVVAWDEMGRVAAAAKDAP